MYSYLYCKNCVSKLLSYYMQLSDNLPMLVHCWKRVDASVNSLDTLCILHSLSHATVVVKLTQDSPLLRITASSISTQESRLVGFKKPTSGEEWRKENGRARPLPTS